MDFLIIVSLLITSFAIITAYFILSRSKPSNLASEPKISNKAANLTKKYFSKIEVLSHNCREDAWIIVDGKVYDVTNYVDIHPGGDSILNHAGEDSSTGFHGPQHPATAADVLNNYYVGDLKE